MIYFIKMPVVLNEQMIEDWKCITETYQWHINDKV